MSRYDGLIIPRSYNEYINKTDPVAMSQALQLNNVLAQEVAAGNNKAVTSNAVNGALTNVEWTVRTNINNDEELFWWLINHPYKQALLYLQYDSEFLGCTAGEFVIYGSRDAGIVKGQFTETYGRQTVFFIEINLNAHELRTKEQIATKSDLTNKMNVIPLNINGASTEVSINCKSDINEFKTVIVSGWITATGFIFDVISFFTETGIAIQHLGTVTDLQYNTDIPNVIKITNTTDEWWKDFKGRVIYG